MRAARQTRRVVKKESAAHLGRVAGLSISVVIPVLNEADFVRRSLESTRVTGVERIVVDGGSQDGSLDVARELKADKLLSSPRGRSIQMERGFRASQGEVVLFLHADTRLDPDWAEGVATALADPRIAGGAFRLRFTSTRWRYRFLEAGVDLRSLLFRLPYGDQGLFIRRELLVAAGGIAPVPIFEDLDLVRLMRRSGRIARLPQRAWTSPRRYERNGIARQVVRNLIALGAYRCRVERGKVARWYRRSPAR